MTHIPRDRPEAIIETDGIDATIGATESPLKFLVCVDGRAESKVALRLACIKAAKRQGLVDILHVIEPAEAQSLFGVTEKMREERVEEAQLLLNELSHMAEEITLEPPTLLLREGPIGETIVQVAEEDEGVNMLVLGVATSSSSRGKLVAWLSTQLGDKLLMPIMLVPGNLTDQQIVEIS